MSENRKNEINMPSSENTLAFNINRFLSVNFRTWTAYMAEFVMSRRIKLTANNAMKKASNTAFPYNHLKSLITHYFSFVTSSRPIKYIPFLLDFSR